MTATLQADEAGAWRTQSSYAQSGALGLLWGLPVAATTFELNVNTQGLANGLVSFFAHTMPLWCATGLLLAWAEAWLSRRLPALLAVGLALLAAAAGHVLIVLVFPGQATILLGHPPQLETIFVFALWNVVCLGGVLLGALVIARRQAWKDMLVTYGEIARIQDQARLSQAELQGLRGQLPPSVLLTAIAELKRRYAGDSAAGERLLDRLIAFLRAAMPSIRTGRSTLSAELETIKAYAELMEDLDPQRGPWSVTAPDDLPEVRFPPLVLLPAMEAVSRTRPTSPLLLAAREAAGVVTLEAAADWLDPGVAKELEAQLRDGLRGGHASGATMAFEEGLATPSLVIRFPAMREELPDGSAGGRLPNVNAHPRKATA